MKCFQGFVRRYASLFSRRDVWKPLIIVFAMFLMQQFSGLSTISFYAVNVLADSHSSVNEVFCLLTILCTTGKKTRQSIYLSILMTFNHATLFRKI